MLKKKENLQLFIFGLLLFAFLLVFFVIVHPLVIFDTDDWNYIFAIRSAIPTWGDWNPTRLFPEIMMAVVSQLAANIIYPISGDYIGAMIWGHGLFTSVVILVYVICFIKLIREKFKVTSEESLVYATLFVVFHFVIFRKVYVGNEHLFYSSNVTCYYYYLLPTLLNCIAVMELMRIEHNESLWKAKTAVSKGIFFLLVYLCIFSNLYCSVVLMAYVGEKLLVNLCVEVKEKRFRLVTYVKENKGYIVIFILWIIQQIFDMNGGRAADVSNGNLLEGILAAMYALWSKVYVVNYWFAGIVLAIVLVTVVVAIKNRKDADMKKELVEVGHVLLALFFVIVYLVILSGASSPGYIARCDVLVGPAFFGFLIVFMDLVLVAKRYSSINTIIPFLIFLFICETSTSGNTFRDSNMWNLPAETCIEISNDVVEQVKTAVDKGATSMRLYVPDFETTDNWPIAKYGGYRIPSALSKHGVIRQSIEIEIVPTKEKNEQFHLK